MGPAKKTSITPTPDGPYLVNGLKHFANQKGPIETKETMLARGVESNATQGGTGADWRDDADKQGPRGDS